MVNVPELLFAGITRLVGWLRVELLPSEIATEIPPDEAGLLRVTVQELLPPDTSAVGLQTIDDTRGRVDAIKLIGTTLETP